MLGSVIRMSALCVCLGLLGLMTGCASQHMSTSDDMSFSGFGGPNGMKEIRMTDGIPFRLVSGDHPGSAVDAARRERLAAMEASLADVYFEYDRSSVRKGDRPMIERNAQFLKSEQDWQLLISGHCDERGSESYNLVLGERRARSVQRYLVDLGIPSSQMQIVSYGKEKPFCGEHDTNCWQQNRRAHFAMQ